MRWGLLVVAVIAGVGWATSAQTFGSPEWGTFGEWAGALGTVFLAGFAFATIRNDQRRLQHVEADRAQAEHDRARVEHERDAERAEAEKERLRAQARRIHGWWQADGPLTYRMVVRNTSEAPVTEVHAQIGGDQGGPGSPDPMDVSLQVPTLPPGAEESVHLERQPAGGTHQPWVEVRFFDANHRHWLRQRGRLEQLAHPDGLHEGEDLSD
jgi:hypothetical protein